MAIYHPFSNSNEEISYSNNNQDDFQETHSLSPTKIIKKSSLKNICDKKNGLTSEKTVHIIENLNLPEEIHFNLQCKEPITLLFYNESTKEYEFDESCSEVFQNAFLEILLFFYSI